MVGAYSAPAGGAGTFTQVTLWNNSQKGDLKALYGIIVAPAAAGSFISVYQVTSPSGAISGFVTACKFNEAIGSGQIYSSALAALPANPLMVLTTQNGLFFTLKDTPWFSIPSGFGIMAVNQSAAAALSVSYFFATLD